jgi:2-methylcitrate dehydratase PrpD
MADLTHHIAAFIRDASFDGPAGALFDKAEKVIADTFAAILSGAGSEVAPPVLRYLKGAGATGTRPILGTDLKSSAEMSALVNGTFGAALDFDDVLPIMPGHPSAVIVPALCAMAPEVPVDGRSFIDAYVIGIEVGAKIARGIGFGHYRRGFHGTGTLCVFSAVAALARLRRLGPADTATALAIAASMASGLQSNFGTMTKPLHSGLAARSAIAACSLAEAGFTASHTTLDGNAGFFAVYGTAESDPQRTIEALGKPWSVLDPGSTLKKFSCCLATHRAIDGLQRIKAELGLRPENLAQVICHVAPGALTPLPYAAPITGLESKFSMQYALAAGIADEAYSIWTFTDPAVTRPGIANLLPRIDVVEDPACVADDPDYRNRSYSSRGIVFIEARTVDGRTAKAEVHVPPGNPARELSWDDMASKFEDCAAYAGVPPARAQQAFAGLRNLRQQPSMEALLTLLQTDRRPG